MTVAHGFVEQHGAHLGLVLIPTLLMLGLAFGAELWTWLRRRRTTARPAAPATTDRAGSIRLAGHLSLVAGVIHLVAAPAHVGTAVIYGVFFITIAFAQVAWAMDVAVRPHRHTLLIGIAGNAAVVALWLVTRTVGIPLGPESGRVEAVGALDLICAGIEIGIVALSVHALRSRTTGRLVAV
jgi:hypothetical protein